MKTAPVLVTILTKPPIPGRVKTRLSPAFSPIAAAALHECLFEATLEIVRKTGLPYRLSVAEDPPRTWSAAREDAGDAVIEQTAGHLGEKMRACIDTPGRHILLGTDCVVFEPSDLHLAASAQGPVAIAPADDGGYWMIAVDSDAPTSVLDALFGEIAWSTHQVLAQTLQRCATVGLSPVLLPTSYDIDEPADVVRLLHDTRCPPRVRACLQA